MEQRRPTAPQPVPERIAVSGRYLDVDELTLRAEALASARPDLVGLRRIGSSRSGEPIRLLSVGRGSRDVLVVAGPHANEPVGGVTALRLARYLCGASKPSGSGRRSGPADTAWHFVLCADPDGARRNERWIKGPMTLSHHFRNFYRPGFAGQPEWLPTEPGAAALPETAALLGLQDELRPYLQCSLHGVDVGGTFVQLTRSLPGFSGHLTGSARDLGIPVERGPYDAFFWPSPGPGVFDMPRPRETDQFASLPAATATSTWAHPHRYGTVTAIIESPMWAADAVADTSRHPDPYAALETISRTLAAETRYLSGLLERVRPGLPDSAAPLLTPVAEFLAVSADLAGEWSPDVALGASGALPPMNRARVMALRIAARRLMMRSAGLLHQMLDDGGEGARGHRLVRGAAPEVRAELQRFLTEGCEAFEADCRVRWIPVSDQVEHQFRVVLAAAELAARTSRTAPAPEAADDGPPDGDIPRPRAVRA
ncbi:M14 family zinc carboxypeptidase [Streptomyces sp. NBC_01429]|uniref:M14 family zinc carboxypeptidase n=1 Tax=Streptomyces sp. NBC_01429 TaxID=2903862 RepID=UPI002E2D765D|nr:M14 family zinc carboxypeptidase [Streptomyces sp. NBC_01429]